MKKEKDFIAHRIPLHLIHCECTTEINLTGQQSGNDLPSGRKRCSNV